MYSTKKLSEICDIQNGYAFKSDDYTENWARLIRITNVQSGYIWDDNPKFLPLSYTKNYDDFSIQENDILISLTWNVWRVWVFPKDLLPALLNQRVGRFTKINNAIINEKYLFLYLNSNFFVTEVIKYAEWAAQKNTSTKKIKDIKIPLPPLSTQSKIVAKLDEAFGNIDRQISLLNVNIEDVERMRKSAMEESFQSGEYEVKSLWDIFDVRDGTHDSPKFHNTGYPLITSKNLTENGIDFGNIKFISQEDYDKINQRSKVDKWDLLFAMIGTIGSPTIVDIEPEFAIKNVALFKKKSEVANMQFLKYFLSSQVVIEKMILEAKWATQKFVWLGYLRQFSIPLPPLPRQHEIVEYLDQVFTQTAELRSSYEAQIRDLETLRQSLLEEAFAGRLVSE